MTIEHEFTDTSIKIVKECVNKIYEWVNYTDNVGIDIPKAAISRTFHDLILKELKKQKDFSNARDNISDLAYKGERWELKTSITKSGIGVNKVNLLEKVKILMVNAIPEKGEIFQIRILDSRDRYFKPASAGTQIRSLNNVGKEKSIKIFP